jgi:hypothetical protein
METLKDLKQAQKTATRQQALVKELDVLVLDIDRCEKTIAVLQSELNQAGNKYPSPRTTREDIDYLTDLLRVANKKLAWEKQIASVQKRAPGIMEQMAQLMQDPTHPPSEQTRTEVLRALKAVQAAMERLHAAKPV